MENQKSMMGEKLAAYLKKGFTNKYSQKGLWGLIKTSSKIAMLWSSLAYLKLIEFQLRFLPTEAVARFKGSINPATYLDYDKASIRLAADNLMSFQRSNSCKKEPETIHWLEENIKEKDVFYDIGANVGAYSLVADKFCNGDITVYAFEPSFSTFQLLCKNIILNNCQNSIFPYMICLSEKEQLETLNYFSVDAGQSKHTIGNNYIDCTGKHFTPEYRQIIFGYSIDFLVRWRGFAPPNLIKLDVDGTEIDILRGASETLKNGTVRSILVEASPEEPHGEQVLSFLHNTGFVLDREVKHGATTISNLIFKSDGQK
jgi:FkbM family methyltransferase